MTRESKAAFARRQGVSHQYVTKLAQAGRLVMADGRVEVEASLARLDATKDPNRADVVQRNAKDRDEKRLAAMRSGAQGALSTGAEGGDKGGAEKTRQRAETGIPATEAEPVIQAAEVFRKARAAKMHFEARRAVIRVARIGGRLAEVAAIRKCAGNDGATLRSMLENLPDQAAPRLAPVRDPAGVAAILGELLADIEATMAGLLTKNSAAMRESEVV